MPTPIPPATPVEAFNAMCFTSVGACYGLQRTRWSLADRALYVYESGGDMYNILYDAITNWGSISDWSLVPTSALTKYNAILTRELNELCLVGLSPDLLNPRDERWNLQKLTEIWNAYLDTL